MVDSKLRTVIIIATLTMAIAWVENTCAHAGETISSSEIWSGLLQRTPYPYTIPLAPEEPTAIDGTYTKFELKDTPPIPCRRCPDYAPEGGLWKMKLHALEGGASRKGISFYIVPLDPVLKGGAYGALAGQLQQRSFQDHAYGHRLEEYGNLHPVRRSAYSRQ
jgi:hypothetical protein